VVRAEPAAADQGRATVADAPWDGARWLLPAVTVLLLAVLATTHDGLALPFVTLPRWVQLSVVGLGAVAGLTVLVALAFWVSPRFDRFFERCANLYERALRLGLRRRVLVYLVLLAFVGLAIFAFTRLGQELFPEVDASEFTIHLRASGGPRVETTEEQVRAVCEKIESLGFRPHAIPGAQRTAIGITGNQGMVEAGFEELPGVAEVIRVSKPYKLVSRDVKEEDTVINFPAEKSGAATANSALTIGGRELAIIAGPCAIESREQAFAIAERVHRAGAQAAHHRSVAKPGPGRRDLAQSARLGERH